MDSLISTHTPKHLYSLRSFDVSVNSLENNTEEAEEAKKAKEGYEVLEEILATLPCSDGERERVRQQYRMLAALGKYPYFLARR
jgi:hypothetical protein